VVMGCRCSLLQSENMDSLVQMVVGVSEDSDDEKMRFKYVSVNNLRMRCLSFFISGIHYPSIFILSF